LNDSITALSVGFPGLLKSSFTLTGLDFQGSPESFVFAVANIKPKERRKQVFAQCPQMVPIRFPNPRVWV
jgi:hypothetical protein